MGIGTNEVSVFLEHSIEDCMAAARAAINGLKKFSIKSESPAMGMIQANVAPGLTSTTWCDTVTVTFSADASGKTKMTVNSSTKVMTLAAGSQQTRNINAFVETFEVAIARYPKIKPTATTGNADYTQELIKLKDLVDLGILTQEEFDAKKKQLLGL